MKHLLGAVFAALLSASAQAQSVDAPQLPATMKFNPIPFASGAEAAALAGDQSKAENYTLRVRLKADAKIPPHTHPDTRMVVVLTGELFAGRGEKVDAGNGVALPAGSFFVVPAGAIHWAWGKNGEVVYQEFGFGPTATKLVSP